MTLSISAVAKSMNLIAILLAFMAMVMLAMFWFPYWLRLMRGSREKPSYKEAMVMLVCLLVIVSCGIFVGL